jgi:hypothetical protein
MPDAPERHGDERTSRTEENRKLDSQDQPDRPGQPGNLSTRDRGGKIGQRTPDQAEGERGDGA